MRTTEKEYNFSLRYCMYKARGPVEMFLMSIPPARECYRYYKICMMVWFEKKCIRNSIYYMHFVVGQTITIIINATNTSPPQQYYLIINQTRSCEEKNTYYKRIHRNALDLLFNRRRYRLRRRRSSYRPPPSRTAVDRVPRGYRAV